MLNGQFVVEFVSLWDKISKYLRRRLYQGAEKVTFPCLPAVGRLNTFFTFFSSLIVPLNLNGCTFLLTRGFQLDIEQRYISGTCFKHVNGCIVLTAISQDSPVKKGKGKS